MRLNSEKVQTVAIVYELAHIKTFYVKYEFFVNGKRYKGNMDYSPKYETFSIGDTIPIFYQKSDPRNNVSICAYKQNPYFN